MIAIALKPLRAKNNGATFLPGQVIDLPEEKALEWAARGLVSIQSPRSTKEEADPETLPAHVDWESPLFGRLSGGPVLELTETTFTLVHPLTGERVTLSREWLATMDERSAILEYEGGLSRGKADRKARGMIFNQFRGGEKS